MARGRNPSHGADPTSGAYAIREGWIQMPG